MVLRCKVSKDHRRAVISNMGCRVAFENILRCFLYFPIVSSDSCVSCTNKQAIMYDHLCILSLIEFLAPKNQKIKRHVICFCETKKTRPLQPGLPQRVVHACGCHAAATGCHSGTQHLDAATVAGGSCCGAAQATH